MPAEETTPSRGDSQKGLFFPEGTKHIRIAQVSPSTEYRSKGASFALWIQGYKCWISCPTALNIPVQRMDFGPLE